MFDYTEGYPAVINDAPLFAKTQALLPQLKVLDKPEMIAEDFAFYQRKIPGVFFFLGTGTGLSLIHISCRRSDRRTDCRGSRW